jgi:hypothetical protein
MKLKFLYTWFISSMAIFSICTFQALWIYDAYQMKEKEVQGMINTKLLESVNAVLNYKNNSQKLAYV